MIDRSRVLAEVHDAIRQRDPTCFARGERWRPGGILDLHDQLLRRIECTLRSPPPRRGPPIAGDVCRGCFYLTPAGLCPHRDDCVLYRNWSTIAAAIADAATAG